MIEYMIELTELLTGHTRRILRSMNEIMKSYLPLDDHY